ncbi:alginate lyase family protein [Paenalcaligenes faecalis]|uniref:alginate lyase family protein n=1 Tax=Paenalcaligenes faecalis TaxID=2980099 RepID=UPI0022B9BC70|nr:alginate lyase family protein [Paenalcaligenes faecalis]
MVDCTYFSKGNEAFKIGNYLEASELYKKSLSENEFVYCYKNLAVSLWYLGDYLGAREAMLKAYFLSGSKGKDLIEKDKRYFEYLRPQFRPDFFKSNVNFQIACREKQYRRALKYYKRLIEINPNVYLYYEGAGLCYKQLNEHSAAIDCFTKAYKLNTKSLLSYQNLRTNKHQISPKLSIIVPVYNSSTYLSTCIQSILSQSEKSIELIIINDGSTDSSKEIINHYASLDERIVAIHNSIGSGSPGIPRNQGIAAARGIYLGFVDSDDWIDPNYFEHLIKEADKGNYDLVFSAGYYNEFNTGETKKITYDESWFLKDDTPLYKYHQSFMIWDKLYRTSLLQNLKIQLGKTQAAVDVPFIFKVYYWFKNVGFTKNIGYHYRRESKTSVTINKRKKTNCEFEFIAYDDVDLWSNKYVCSREYKDIISYRMVNSLVYTLDLIDATYFVSFFRKTRDRLLKTSKNSVLSLAKLLKKDTLIKKYDLILENDIKKYLENYRTDIVDFIINQKTLSNKNISEVSCLDIKGTKPGVIFVSDFSASNPYQKLFYASLSFNYDVQIKGLRRGQFKTSFLKKHKDNFKYLHLHWLHSLIDFNSKNGADNLIEKLRIAKQLGYKIIYTAHNIISHNSANIEQEIRLRKQVTPYFDYVIAHGKSAKEEVINNLDIPADKIHVMPHGSYQGYYKNHIKQVDARSYFNINDDAFVFLFLGNIKKYKGIDVLLNNYKKIKEHNNNIVLIIAGKVDDLELHSLIESHRHDDGSIIYNPGYVDDSRLQYYFNAADISIFPYTNILTSGSVALSVSFHCPIIAPNTGTLPELITNDQHGYLYNNERELLDTMNMVVTEKKTNITGWKQKFNFNDLLEKLRWSTLTSNDYFSKLFASKPYSKFNVKNNKYRYAIVRILGNDLPGRHSEDQTYNNLNFTLQNESDFQNCIKIWILNRIVDSEKKRQLISLLNSYEKHYIDIPFFLEDVKRIPYCFDDLPKNNYKLTSEYKNKPKRIRLIVDTAILRQKNNYLMNNNGARNAAIAEGRKYADWIFPWDGNCYISDNAWKSIERGLSARADLPCHIVPMERLASNDLILDSKYTPNPLEEPQIIFRHDANIKFNEKLMYGLQPKVELLKRLGVPGIWDNWTRLYPWNEPLEIIFDKYSYNYSWTGWTARLFSGNAEQETDGDERANARRIATIKFIQKIDHASIFNNFESKNLTYYSINKLNKLKSDSENKGLFKRTMHDLKSKAIEYMANPLYTVLDKTTLPPSREKNDYWHPAPYAWPNPRTADGLPYVHRDGERVPGTRMYEKDSIKYDRTNLQKVFDETTTLSLAGYIFEEDKYTKKAIDIVRHWFLNEKTAMNPHLEYSQVVMGKNNNRGTASGLIETKDLYFFLDAVRLISASEYWTSTDQNRMKAWCKDFLLWLTTSKQGAEEVMSSNNHGVAFDLQTYALAAYIGDTEQMYQILLRALSRMKEHVERSGWQTHEMKRTTTAHYTAFNLHLWCNLSVILRTTAKYNIFNEIRTYDDVVLNPLKKASMWVLDRASEKWKFKQIDKFDNDRYQHLYHTMKVHSDAIREKYNNSIDAFEDSKVIFFPHDGIAPFWTLQA